MKTKMTPTLSSGLLLLALLLTADTGACQSARRRVARQEDGEFWWLKKSESAAPADADAGVDARKEGSINAEVVAQILSKGPEGAASIPSPHPGECICVPYYQCKAGEIITDGAGIIDIRLKPKPSEANATETEGKAELVGGNCPGSIEVCCRDPLAEPLTPAPAPLPTPPEPVPATGEELPPPPPSKYESVCGVRNADGLNVRITNFKNNEAQYGEFPWMVAVLKPTVSSVTGKINDVYQCGGSLVHPQVVLTAAHCVAGKEPSSLKIRVGEWDTQSVYEFFPHQDRQVVDAVLHEQYYPAALFNDVALLFLESPIDLGPESDTICLPRPTDVYDGTRCFATGWGKDQFGQAGKYQHILKKIELPLVPRDICQIGLRKTRLGPAFRLHDSFVCAGGEPGRDTCKGDGGSPLVCPIAGTKNRFVQVGIVAWGIGCGELGIPGVYASVIKASDWIQEKITIKMKLDPQFFLKQLPVV